MNPIDFRYRSPIKIALASYKGGVAKTTSTAAIASCLARRGKSVLAVDMDGQGDLSSAFQVEPTTNLSTYDAIIQTHNHWPSVYAGNNVSVTPSGPEMETLLDDLRGVPYLPDIAERMKVKVDYIKGYDYLLFDCPPALNAITRAAISASDYVIIPAIPTPMSLKALARTTEYVGLIAGEKSTPSVLGILLTMCEPLNLHRDAIAVIEESFSGLPFKTVIPRTVEMEKMILRGYSRDPLKRNLGLAAYEAVTEEIIDRIHNNTQ